MEIDRAFREYRTGLILVDALALSLGLVFAISVRHSDTDGTLGPYLETLPYAILITIVALRCFGAYSVLRGGLREMRLVAGGLVTGAGAMLALSFFYRSFSYSTVMIFIPLGFTLLMLLRSGYRAAVDHLLGNSIWLKRTVVIGRSRYAEELVKQLAEYQAEYTVFGRISSYLNRESDRGAVDGVPDLGTLDELERILDETRPDLVILADPEVEDAGYQFVIQACYERDIHWKVIPKVTTPPDQDTSVMVLGGIALIGDRGNNITGFNFLLKRFVDLVTATLLLILLSPIMITVAALIKIFSKGPVFFIQERIGFRGRPFRFYKFRSMQVQNDDSIHREYVKSYINGCHTAQVAYDKTVVHKITRDPRVIPYIGGVIRKLSIDELPQLLNVIQGDMSLVGPRPCLPYEAEHYRRWHKMRFDVLPGITGLWQVSGRNRLTFDQMVRLDIGYLQNWSLGMDIMIMARTPFTIFFDKAF